jgi:hypothetical protein
MPGPDTSLANRIGIAMVVILVVGPVALAQEDDDAGAAASEEVIDEIVVTAGKRPGGPVDVDALYEEMMRDRLMIDLDRLQVLEEQNTWRGNKDMELNSPSRIQWGYKPQDDIRMGRESNISDASFITTKPASVFQFEF